ncbi:MAG TPA: DHH family phosphoesterase [Candidatus Limivivens intestinipullorum]|uniref:Cyclic-di-AMP phosphodiesterase n=1 Tax=Candidatus Limivivens intestinipullorum TaxID=2840858 RepID=A0A9D1EUL7_9FIRM|nr:DHH family phosphoesterase [Candidatus Limivivens intestinipullorum]
MILFLLAMNIVVYVADLKAGLVTSVFLLVYSVIMLVVLFRYKPNIMNEMISFATQYGQIQKTLLNEFSIPYALLDSDGKVIWMNKEFCRVTGKDRQYRKSISSLFPEIGSAMLAGIEEQCDVDIHFADRDYSAKLQKVSIEELARSVTLVEVPENSNFMIAMYLFDQTELVRYKKENEDQQMVAGLIYLDNYDEALDSVEEVRRSLLVALIDRKISKYISAYDGILKKIEKDKYFVVIKNKYLEELKSNRFSLLEEVKGVNIGNEMSVTLSIGIGVGGNGYLQNYEFSRIAIELALGRGGDQAVVKNNEQISYYGGKSQQMEKSTRVKARVKAHALREFIGAGDDVVVMGHKITDIDSFGAAIGIYRAARMLNKKAHIVIGDINGSIRPWINMFLESREYDEYMFVKHERAMEIVDENTVLVVVDTNRPSMCECEELLSQTKTIVVLDHHRQSSEVIRNAVLSYIEPYASSACEMVAEILQYFSDDVRLKSIEADSIYAGIIIDTNNFLTKTGVRTFEAAAFLRRCGADVTRVRKMFRDDMPSYKARAEAVRHAQVFMDCYAIAVCPSENLESPTIVGAQAANELLNIVGIRASFVLTEFHKRIYISARAIDEVNVQIIMERLGGGGHLNIAGAQLDGVTVEEARARLKDTITRMTEEGAI